MVRITETESSGLEHLLHLADGSTLTITFFLSLGEADSFGQEIPTGEKEINEWVKKMIKRCTVEVTVSRGELFYEREFGLKNFPG